MKRIFAAALFAGLALQAGAQTFQDAVDFSGNDYLGTARSVGMGNAMTAVGGDLGSLTFNPAGSAVASYSQFTLTPGLSVSSVFGQGTYMDGAPFGFEDGLKTPSTRMNLPNFGAIMVYDTRNSRGLKRVSFGIVGNITRDYNNYLRASGTNDKNTLSGALASWAEGYTQDKLSGDFYAADAPSWESMVAWKGGVINPIPGRNDGYVGLTERIFDDGNIALADKIGQYYGLKRAGSKYDLLMNFGLDFNDRFYLGANLGLVTIDYRSDETRSEEALPGIDYGNGFQSLRMRSSLRDVGSGIYLKVGFIARPFDGFRIGAAVQTPTLFDIREVYQLEGQSIASNDEMLRSSPQDEWFFRLKSPFRANVGVAYTINKLALLSADYEFADYSGMKLSPAYDDAYYYDFSNQNMDIKDFAGPVHAIRLGAELKPSPELALRVGYNLTTGAQYNTLTEQNQVVSLSDEERKAQLRSAVSFGIGYSSKGSFFVDAAIRFQYLPNEYFTPYWYYDNGERDYSVVTPEVCSQSALCNALVTLGWRF